MLATEPTKIYCSGCKGEFEKGFVLDIEKKSKEVEKKKKELEIIEKKLKLRRKEFRDLSNYQYKKIEIILTKEELEKIKYRRKYEYTHKFFKKHLHKLKIELNIEIKPDKDYNNLCIKCDEKGTGAGSWGVLGFMCQSCVFQDKIYFLMDLSMRKDRFNRHLNLDLTFNQWYLIFSSYFDLMRGERKNAV